MGHSVKTSKLLTEDFKQNCLNPIKKNMYTSRKNLSLIGVVAMVIISATMVESAPQGMAGIGGCPCSGFKTVATNGQYVGECLATDQTGFYYCYVHKSCGNCEGVTGSFPEYCKNYQNCRYFGNVHPNGSENSDEENPTSS